MKNLYLILFLFFNVWFVNSQTFELYDKTGTLISNGDTIKVDSLPNVSEMTGSVKLKNISSQSVNVYCQKIPVYEVIGTSNTFCWGVCFSPTIFISPNPVTINAGETNEGFTGHYSPSNKEGVTLIRYLFSVIHGDSACIFIKFNAAYTGVSENKLNEAISEPYPNPAKTNAYINYNISANDKAYIQIYNIYGKIEKQFNINGNNGVLNMNISDLPSGMYFCILNINGKVSNTNRLIVSH